MFTIDFENIISNNLAPHLRRLTRQNWLNVITAGLSYVYALFLDYRTNSNYSLAFRGQTIYLEKLLNERFDNTDIEIVNLDPAELVYIANSGSGYTNIYVSNVGGTNELSLGDKAYYDNIPDFEVQVPAAIYASIDKNEMRSILNKFVFSSMNYIIISK